MAGNPIAVFGPVQVIVDNATQVFDASSGGYFSWTLGASRTMTAPANPPNGCQIIIEAVQDATGTRLVTWPASFSWAGGTAPTLSTVAGSVDVVAGHYNATAGKWRMRLSGAAFA